MKTLFWAAIMAVLLSAGAAVGVPCAKAREVVRFEGYMPGTVVVKTRERRLYYVTGNGQAIRYPVGVGRAGKAWTGSTFITSVRMKPAWSPPAEIKRDKPSIPDVIPGGSPRNPMGAAALLLAKDQYAIHGTNAPGTIGGFVSYGCIRMHNADILHLIERVHMGTPVIVTR
jgi:lipoprotein-anchoring transpeptidase ErfK/SrfK